MLKGTMSLIFDSHLSSLYKQQLRSLNPELPAVIEHLVSENVLTRSEAIKVYSTSDQFSRLCQLLASKGADKETAIVSGIESFRKTERRDAENGKRSELRMQRYSQHNMRAKDIPMLSGHERERRGTGSRGQGVEVAVIRGGNTKRQLQSAGPNEAGCAGRESATSVRVTRCEEMELFIVKFHVFITQLLSHYEKQESSGSPLPAWFHLDLSRDQVLAYFPSHLRRSIKDSSHNHDGLESVSLSDLLGAFKSFVKKYDFVVHENRLLTGKAKLVQSLTERNAHLEDEIWKYRKPMDTQPSGAQRSLTRVPIERERESTPRVRREQQELEARVKELTVINEQWALECQEKASQVTILQIQLEDAQSETESVLSKLKSCKEQVQQLQSDRSKLKRRLSKEMRQQTEGEACSDQEMILKLQLQQERDLAVEENIHLKAELQEAKRQREEDQDELEELKDRAANFKVQAQSKEPSVKELAALSNENRQLRETVDKSKTEREKLMKTIGELETNRQQSTPLCNGTKHGRSSAIPTSNGVTYVHTANKSGVLVQPLWNDNTVIQNGDTSSGPIPPFYDSTPLAPHKTTESSKQLRHAELSKFQTAPNDVTSVHDKQKGQSTSSKTTRETFLPRSPVPNQPVAEVIGGLRLPLNERQCPTCQRVFLMLGEREFQSHVAGCRYAS